jgi:hypothetical protein
MVAFLSYSSSNYPVVVPLVYALSALGQQAPFERKTVGAQVRWRRVAADIEASDLFISTLTSQSLISYTCWLELDYAAQLGKRILPILLADIDFQRLPAALEGLAIVDFRKQDEAARAALAQALQTLPPASPLPAQHSARLDWMAPLEMLRERVDNLDNSYDEQSAILFNLREFAERQETLETTAKLLEALARHELFIYPRTAKQIERTLSDIHKARAQRKKRRTTLMGAAVSLAVAVPMLLLSARSVLLSDAERRPSPALIVQGVETNEETFSPTASPTLTATSTRTSTSTATATPSNSSLATVTRQTPSDSDTPLRTSTSAAAVTRTASAQSPTRTPSQRPTTQVPAPIPSSTAQHPTSAPSTTFAAPTNVPPTSIPPTSVPPTNLPPTPALPTSVPPTQPSPTNVPPTSVPPTSVPPTPAPPTSVPPTQPSPTSVPPTSVPPLLPPIDLPLPPIDLPLLPPINLAYPGGDNSGFENGD